jgi:nicotinamide riboside kinase
MESFIINIIGGPSSGKSTTYSLLYAKLKIAGESCEQVPERAKKLVWAKKFDILDNQYHVSTKQYEDLAAVYGQVKYVITDGSLLHGLYYNRYNPTNVSNVSLTEQKILEYYNKFNNINIFLKRGSFEYEQAGRIQNEKEAHHVDIELKNILNHYNIPFYEFDSAESSIPQIIELILQK